MSNVSENLSETKDTEKLPSFIVGVGASAGGLEALQRLFERMPDDTGMAFVVVQHLSPDFKSLMDELLSRWTRLPVYRVADGMRPAANAIYLIPPSKEMIIAEGQLLLTDKDPAEALTLPIDRFFYSLAQEFGSHAVGIVLSGTGSDGSRGIIKIHEAGGLVIAQREDTAKFDGMPRSARETGVVKLFLSPEEMPAALQQYAKDPNKEQLQQKFLDDLPEGGLPTLFHMLRDAYGIDFSHYKLNTIVRRTERRVQLSSMEDLKEYVEKVRNEPQELTNLYRDLLIGVTRFFRDERAYERLGEVLGELLRQSQSNSELRIWVAGCATGEEAYSIAILVEEQLRKCNRCVDVKIFATDVHKASLEFAGLGTYSQDSVAKLSAERLEKYFKRIGDSFQVSPELRKMVVFAQHNIVKDAPFTRMDLITCRNLLIYLQPQAQKKAISLFHFGLRTGGILFLGPSETPGEFSDEFDSLDHHWKVYRKRRDVRLAPNLRLPLSTGATEPVGPSGLPAVVIPGKRHNDGNLMAAFDFLLNKFMPPGILVNERREILYTFSGASRYMKQSEGHFSADLLDRLIPDLKMAVSAAIQRVLKKNEPFSYRSVHVSTVDGDETLRVTVLPIHHPRSSLTETLVLFERSEPPVRTSDSASDEANMPEITQEQISSLETELHYAKENLQAMVEELETSNEELQATNQELIASNEELQSTNEELHSVNEELYTVNAEHQKKIEELTELTNDMDNLLGSTNVHTVFLDSGLRIRKFTPGMGKLFNLIPADVGREISSFTYNLDCPDLVEKITSVLAKGEPVEQQVQDRSRRSWFLLRLLPYRSSNNAGGVVLTLIDITSLKAAQDETERMSAIVEHSNDAIISKDLDGRILTWNPGAQRMYGYDEEEVVGRHASFLFPNGHSKEIEEAMRRAVAGKPVRNIETYKVRKDGKKLYVSLSLFPIRSHDGTVVSLCAINRDITERHRFLKETQEKVRQRDQFLAMLSHELRNPLSAILNASALLKSVEDGPSVRHACGVIGRQSAHMACLLDDLLDVTRVIQGKIHLQKEAVDLVDVTSDAVEATKPALDSRDQELTLVTPDEPFFVSGDAARLQQVLVNLLTNASKYSPPGESICLTVFRDGREAVLSVKDTGIGIRTHDRESIFEPFFQSSQSLDRSPGGMGLGLTLVRSLVELHGGQISAFSEGLGKGSEFVVRLPLVAPRAKLPTASKRPVSRSVQRIVLIEDNADARDMMKQLLEMQGFEVVAAEDGLSGLETIERETPDAAIVDIGLPSMDGYEVASKVRQSPECNGVFLIALTGYGQTPDKQKALEAGFDVHLVKPLKPDELSRLLGKPANLKV